MSFIVPENILREANMTEDELILEIATTLYKQAKISGKTARNWTGLSLDQFEQALIQRGYCLNYDLEDFQLGEFSS